MFVDVFGSRWIRKFRKEILVIINVEFEGGLSEVGLDVWDLVGFVGKLIIFVLDLEL